jgi:hypothetical protein
MNNGIGSNPSWFITLAQRRTRPLPSLPIARASVVLHPLHQAAGCLPASMARAVSSSSALPTRAGPRSLSPPSKSRSDRTCTHAALAKHNAHAGQRWRYRLEPRHRLFDLGMRTETQGQRSNAAKDGRVSATLIMRCGLGIVARCARAQSRMVSRWLRSFSSTHHSSCSWLKFLKD